MRSVYDTEDFNAIISEHSLVLVDFNATWCGPCKRIKPVLETMSKEFSSVFFCAVDVDNNEELTKRFNITSMPTFHFYRDGTLEENLKVTGAMEKEIRKSLESLSGTG